MRKRRAILAMTLASAMLLSACGSQESSSSSAAASTKNADGKYDPVVTITIAKQLDENAGRYGDGEDINKNPMTDLAVEKLGIKMETTLLGGDASNYDTKLRLALTGSEELPDVFPVYGTQMIADMIESGQVKAFEAVIKAFTEDDPDGNGQKDTYGFTYAGDSIYNTGWVSDPVTLFSANSGKNIPGMWQEDANGDLVYGSICEGNKETLKRMSEWHANGWIFQEAAATGAWDAMMQFTEGKAGIFIGRPWAISSVRDVTTVDPDAVIAAYPTILQDNGECTYQTAQTNDGWLMFNKDFNNMEAFFTYYDWLYDVAFGTGDFQYGYLENYDYDIVNDEVVFDSASFDPAVTDPFVPSKSTVLKNAPFIDNMQAYADAKAGKKETGAQIKAAADFGVVPDMAEGYAIANEHKDSLIPNLFNSEPTDTMKKCWEQLQTMEKQVYTNIIYGKEPIEAFDEFVEEWKAQGGEQITQEVNEWYKTVK